MIRPLGGAAIAAALALAAPGGAVADVGDIEALAVEAEVSGDATTVRIEGTIRCAATLDYGLSVKVAQPGATQAPGAPDSSVEGVGAFGPSVASLADDQPCGRDLRDFDVVVQRNRGSEPFADSDELAPPRNMSVFLVAGTSAADGAQGPGPIVGDLEYVLEDVSFVRSG